jgi:hypothetical protein
MNLKFTKHFQDMVQYREIDIEHVKGAIKNPDKKENVFEGKTRVKKSFGKKNIEVVYFKDGFRDKKDEYIIVTAYYI